MPTTTFAPLAIDQCPTSVESNGQNYSFVDPNGSYSHKTKTYHAGAMDVKRRGKRLHPSHKFTFGFEAEKIDNIALGSADVAALEALGYRLEKDSSLKDANGMVSPAGYELVSPVYELEFMQRFKNDMVISHLKRMIDGNITRCCGGHMALSATGYTAQEVFEGVSGFLPLLYAMYPDRMMNSYSRAKNKNTMAVAPEKMSAVFVKRDYIEFRIFPGIKNTRNLLWRVELLKVMADNFGASEREVFQMMYNKKSELYKLLRKIYRNEAIHNKCNEFITHAKGYNNAIIDINKIPGAKKGLAALLVGNDERAQQANEN